MHTNIHAHVQEKNAEVWALPGGDKSISTRCSRSACHPKYEYLASQETLKYLCAHVGYGVVFTLPAGWTFFLKEQQNPCQGSINNRILKYLEVIFGNLGPTSNIQTKHVVACARKKEWIQPLCLWFYCGHSVGCTQPPLDLWFLLWLFSRLLLTLVRLILHRGNEASIGGGKSLSSSFPGKKKAKQK